MQINIHPPIDALSDFDDASSCNEFTYGFKTVISNPTILLDTYKLPSDNFLDLVDGITCRSAYIVSDGSFDP